MHTERRIKCAAGMLRVKLVHHPYCAPIDDGEEVKGTDCEFSALHLDEELGWDFSNDRD